MKLPALKGPLLYYTITLLLVCTVHLINRSWHPIDRSIRTFESKNVTFAIVQAPIPDPMLQLLTSFSAPEAEQIGDPSALKPKGDRKELGDFFITLLAVYKSGNSHKAILEITEKTSGETQLKHVGTGDSFQDILIESLTGTSCVLRFRDTELNFRLFTPDRAAGTSVE